MKYEIMLGILFELLSKKCVSATYLASKFEVSKRSIYRYIEQIEYAGVPLYTVRGNGGGIAIVDSYRLSSTFLTLKEYNQVINALTSLNNNIPDKLIESAITKLKANVKNEYSGFDIKSGNLIIDAGPWGDTVGYKAKMKIVQRCIENNTQMYIRYHDRNGSVSERTIDPHLIVFKQGVWYVYAFCNVRQEFRFFKIGRIELANELNTHFERKKLNDNLPFDVWYESVDAIDVVLEIDKKYLSDIEEWLGIENIKTENGKHVAYANLPNDDGLVSKIISYGIGVKVLSPIELKNKIKKYAEEIISNY